MLFWPHRQIYQSQLLCLQQNENSVLYGRGDLLGNEISLEDILRKQNAFCFPYKTYTT